MSKRITRAARHPSGVTHREVKEPNLTDEQKMSLRKHYSAGELQLDEKTGDLFDAHTGVVVFPYMTEEEMESQNHAYHREYFQGLSKVVQQMILDKFADEEAKEAYLKMQDCKVSHRQLSNWASESILLDGDE